MKSTVEFDGPARVRVTIDVPRERPEAATGSDSQERSEIWNRHCVAYARRLAAEQLDGIQLPEATREAVLDHVVEAVHQHDLRVVGRPEIAVSKLVEGQDLRLIMGFHIRPEVSLPDVSSITVHVPAVTVDDEEVEEGFQRIREKLATFAPVNRPAEPGDLVQIDVQLRATDTGEVIDRACDVLHELGRGHSIAKLNEKLAGMSANSYMEFRSEVVSRFKRSIEADVTVTVTAVAAKHLPELDSELSEGSRGLASMAELRNAIRDQIETAKRFQQLYAARDRVLHELISATDIPIPVEYIADQVALQRDRLNAQLEQAEKSLTAFLHELNTTEDRFHADLVAATTMNLKAQFALDAYADAAGLEISEEEFRSYLIQRAASLGISPHAFAERLLDDGAAEEAIGELCRGKALARIIQDVVVKDSNDLILHFDDLANGDGTTYQDPAPVIRQPLAAIGSAAVHDPGVDPA